MKRRDFIVSSASALSLATLGSAASATVDAATARLIEFLVQASDAQVPVLLAKQERGAEHRWRGGIADAHGIFTAGGAAGLVNVLACAVSARGSRYFQQAELAEPLRLAAEHLVALQHADGTIDLYTTNFHSPPDTAFVLELLVPAWHLLNGRAGPEFAAAARGLETFITRAASALVTGGIHTPNHRWVVCGALALAHSVRPDPRYRARVDAWLAETIDIDPDGQYTEKSTTVYSPIVNRALLTVARLLDRPELLEPVRRNLEMTLYYVHPDGEVVTEASRRQDRYQRGSMARYYHGYRALAIHDRNGRFAAMAREIERTARAQLRGELAAFLTQPELTQPLPESASLPVNYERVFPFSALARIRREDASGTILAQNTTFFSFRRGTAALEAVRLASAFFGKGQFVGETLVGASGAYEMRQDLEGPYFQPLSPDQIAAGEHVRMAPNGTLASSGRAERERSNVQTLTTHVRVREAQGKFTLTCEVKGTERVPVALELAFRHGGVLQGVEALPDAPDAFLLRDGMGRYVSGSDTIEFGPGQVAHTYVQLRGAVPKWDGQSVYLTALTPCTFTLTVA